MSEALVDTVLILDAIPSGELNTARRLYDSLRDLTYSVNGFTVQYERIETIDALRTTITKAVCAFEEDGQIPFLHLEAHGLTDESGFLLAAGECCEWQTLKTLITPLNVATGLNLVLVLATCFGGTFVRAISTVDRAPVWGLVGPTRELTVERVEIDFTAFYKTFFSERSGDAAIRALNANAPAGLYFRATAEEFFLRVWRGYKRDYCSKDAIAERARRLYRIAREKKLPFAPSVGRAKRDLHTHEQRLFEKYRDTYFMYDLHSANRERFPITYKEAEALAAAK